MNKDISNTIGLVMVNLLPYIVNFLVLPLYSQHIDPEGFGVIGLIMVCVIFASTWTGLQLSSAMARYFFDYESMELKKYISSVVYSTLIISMVFSFLYVVMYEYLSLYFFKGGVQYYSYCLGVGLVFLSVLNTVFERLLVNEKKGLYIFLRSIVAQFFSILVGLFFVLNQGLGVNGFLLAALVYYLVLVFFSFFVIREYFVFSFEIIHLKQSMQYSFPLIFHALGGVVFMYSATFFINEMLSLVFVGLFFVADKFSQVIKSIVNALNNAVMPIYNKISIDDFDQGQKFISNLIPVWFLLVFTGILCFTFLSQSFMSTFMGSEYDDLMFVVMLMSVAYIFRGFYCFSVASIFFTKKTFIVPRITMVTGVFSLVLNYFLILKFELIGAALAVFFSFLVNFLVSLFYANNNLRLDYPLKSLLVLAAVIFSINFPVLYLVKGLGFYSLFIVCTILFLVTLLLSYMTDLGGVKSRINYLRGFI